MNFRLKLRLGLFTAIVLLIGLSFLTQLRLRRSIDDAAWVSHTHEVLTALEATSSAVHLARSSQQELLLTHAGKLAAEFRNAQAKAKTGLGRVRSLTADNPRQQRRLDRLAPLLEQALATQAEHILAARTNGRNAALEYTLTAGRDERQMQQIEICLREMKQEEESLLKGRAHFSQLASQLAVAVAGAGTLMSALFLGLCSLWIARDYRRCEQAEVNLRQLHQGLETRARERTADLSKTTASLEAEIAERRHTETQLRDSEQRYRLLFEDSPLPMEVFDPETLAYLAVNTAAAELYGYSPEEFRRMTLLDIRPPEEAAAFTKYLETVKTADSYSGAFLTRHKSGRLIAIEASIRTVEFGGRKARLKLVTDISEKKRLETQLQQLQKMEAVGRLAGGIAHDFNNILMVILGYSDSILHKLDDADPNRAKVSEIQAAAQRAANLTSQLLAFSRKQILQTQTVQLNGVVSNISQMLRRLLGEDIEISLELDEDLGQILADPTQLEQVLVNLSVNARDAMPQGGQLVIETRNIELDEQSASLEGVRSGKYVLLVVNDTGCGMDEATKCRVFEPFFTTKEVGKGTGLGLSMVLGVVQQSGGTVTVYSEVGLGTTFRIYLPRVDAPVAQAAELPESNLLAAATETGGTILLVEDEKQLRTLAREVLKEAGYTVLEASNGKEALRIANTLAAPPSLLLTDVVMPEMSGLELGAQLHKKWPGLAVVYTSGYTDHALLGRSGLRPDMPFLQKPYMPGSLLEQVASVLDTQRSPLVLVVDDDADTRYQLRTGLSSAGYRVLEAGNGAEGLAQIAAHPVKLVITDLFMPEKDGLELIAELRRSHPEIKILALSGAHENTFLKLASSLGADVVLPKPFLNEQVARMAESLLA